MKKYITLLAAAILAFSLAACESKTDSPTEVPTASTAPQAEAPTTPVHQHGYAKTVIAPTCTAAGYTEFTCACGDSYFQDLINATGHSYGEKVVAPTSDAEGYTEHSCNACGDVYMDSFVDRIDSSHKHSYKAAKTVAPTCLSIGYTVYSCSCGDSYMKNPVDAVGHSYTEKVIEPTIDNKGYTEHSCTACGDVYTDGFVDALPAPHRHLYAEVEVYAPTCVYEGCSLYRCDCGDEFYGSFTATVDHDYVISEVAPTHTTKGFTKHSCTVCGDWYGDNFVECTPEHSYSFLFISEPTCAEEGFTAYQCTCGEIYVDNFVPVVEHTYVVDTVLEPSCAQEGCTIYRCECGSRYTEVYAPALMHKYVTHEVVKPTYEEGGYTVYCCSVCGEFRHGDFTEKLQPEEEKPAEHSCDGSCHEEVQRGGYTYVYCDTIEESYKSEDGLTIYHPYDYFM